MKLIEDIQEVVMTQTWIVLVDSVTARTLINCSNSLNHNDSQYWIVYEQNLDCSFICDINPVTGVENCLTMNSRNKLFCLNVDLGDSNQNETELIKTYFGKTWNNASVKQFDILSAYETVKSTLLALDSLVINNRWPDNFKPSGSSIKVCNQPNRIIDASSTRFYRFAEAITMLPKRNSTIGLIDFNGTVTNQRVKFQMTECFGKSNTSKAGCHRSSISFLYPEMIVQSLQNLSRSASRQLLHVSVLHDPPYAVRLGENQWTGYCVEVFKEIARRLDFDYTFVEQTDGDYGVRLPNGHWSGIIGQVARKNTDVGLGPLVQDAERSLIVDFTVPYYDSVGITMVNKVNEDLKLGALFFLEVFAWDVWVTTVVVVFLIGFMLAFIDKYSPYSYQNQLKEGDGESMGTVFTVKEALWYVLGSCTQQGEYMDPRSASTRVLVAGLWLLVLIIIAMFSANLAAKLTVTGLRGEITTFKQLIEQDTVKYTIINNSTEMRFFEKLKNAEEVIFEIWKQQVVYNNEFTSNYTLWQYPVTEKYGLLYSRMKEWGFTNRREETLQLIKDGWVIFMETPKADYYIAKECKIKRFGKRIGSWYYSMILLPRSPLTSLFNEVIYAMEADYTIDALKAKWWASETSKCEPIAADEGYGFEEVGGMFTLLICGLVIGVILLAGEIIVFQILLKKQKAKVEPEPPNSPPHSPTADNEPVSVQEGKEESVDNTPPAIPIAPASVTVTTTDYDEEEADKAVQSS
uniref:Lig_chan-Glu_bd domain-containing protein n=1 Tax=Trichobilharzia regenti TaxID=157069 RepID=A0AA85JEE6_TRIRE|nr:unnamed protein product [Trichobilharzia regenti]